MMISRVAHAGDITAGPMIGHVTDKSARVWMQIAVAKQVTITCYEASKGQEVSSLTQDVEGPWPFICDLPVSNLSANTTYRIEVKLDGEPVDVPGPSVVIRTTPPPGDEATFTVAFGSSITGPDTAGLFKAVKAVGPRTFLFLGDNGTLPAKLEEFPTTRRATFRYIAEMDSKVRKMPELQDLLRTTACYGIWGEHDFGANNADKDWIFAKESQAAFIRFWANPDWGTPENPGCYFSFTMGDADFFMLDARMYRDPPGGKTMLGKDQLDWLKKSLKESTATFKVIGCANRMLANDAGPDEWSQYPEQKEFLKWLADNQIQGVMFISGGGTARHYGELTTIKSAAGPLLELTSAGLTGKTDDAIADNPNRSGQPVTTNNFATLDFTGERAHRFVRLRLYDAGGKVQLEQTVFVTR